LTIDVCSCFVQSTRTERVPQEQAEAHAEATRDFIMVELATKSDLQLALAPIEAKIDDLSLRLTVRLGTMLVVAIGALATILKLA
jgi:hypothetical protein